MVISRSQFRSSHKKYIWGICLANLLQSCGKQVAYNISELLVNSKNNTKRDTSTSTDSCSRETFMRIIANRNDPTSLNTLLEICPRDTVIEHLKSLDKSRDGVDAFSLALLATTYNQAKVVKLILDTGLDINKKDPLTNNNTLLHSAAHHDHLAVINLLLDEKADVKATNSRGNTPLHLAASQGGVEAAKILIAKGADVDARNKNGDTPLFNAAYNCQNDMTRTLLELKAYDQENNDLGETPLHAAAASMKDCVEVVNTFIGAGVDIDATSKNKHTPLLVAATKGHFEVAKILLYEGADATKLKNKSIELGRFALAAASDNRPQVLAGLLDAGAYIETRDDESSTLLYIAAKKGYNDMVNMLINKRAIVNAESNDGTTPLHIAARHGYTDIVDILLKKGADKNARSDQGDTPLYLAARNSNLAVVKRLLAEKVDVNAQNDEEISALHAVASNHPGREKEAINDDVEIVDKLLAAGAAIEAQNKQGDTPLHSAASSGNAEVVTLLLNKWAKLEAQNDAGETPLFVAAREGHAEVVKRFIAAGATVQVGRNKTSPLFAAITGNHVEVTEMLLKKCSHLSAQVMEVLFQQCAAANRSESEKIRHLLIDSELRKNCTTSRGSRMSGFLPDMIKAVGSGMATTSQYIYHLAFGTAKNYNQGSSIGYNGFDAPLNKALSPYDATNQNLFFMHYVLSFFNKDYRNRTQLTYLSYNELSEEELFLHQLQAAEAMAKLEGWAETIE